MTLIEALKTTLRRLHYSPRTEEAYVYWTREFVRFHDRRHPREMGAAEVTNFLNDLAVRRRVAASTQNQALCALLFLYRKVLEIETPALAGFERARRPAHLPAVLSRSEVLALLDRLEPPFRLLGELLYGAGLRLGESVALRVKDIDLERHQITVRRGKGGARPCGAPPVLCARACGPSSMPSPDTTVTNSRRGTSGALGGLGPCGGARDAWVVARRRSQDGRDDPGSTPSRLRGRGTPPRRARRLPGAVVGVGGGASAQGLVPRRSPIAASRRAPSARRPSPRGARPRRAPPQARGA